MEKKREYANLHASIQIFDSEIQHLVNECKSKDDGIQHFDDQFPPSHVHFPTVIKTYKSGSVSEKLDLEDSDLDYIYEIGPAIVRDKSNNTLDSVENTFYHLKTLNDGFYRIEDRDGKFVYPVCLQRALYHTLNINENERDSDFYFNNIGKEKARLREQDAKKFSVDEKPEAPSASISSATKDKVIALRLEKWPMNIKKDFLDRKTNFKEFSEIPLFLIPKSHPESQNPMVEWRLSFSLVEKEILLNLPLSWRKVYLIIKSQFKESHEQSFEILPDQQYYQSPLESYHIKTVLLWLYEKHTDFDENDIIGLLKLVVDRLLEAFSEMKLPNYFIPGQNILRNAQKYDFYKIERVKEMLEKIKLVDNLMFLYIRGSMLNQDYRKTSFTTSRATKLKENGFLDNIPDNANLKLMFVAEIYNECMIHLTSFLSLLFHEDKDNDLSKEKRFHRKSVYQLATLRFGFSELKETKNQLICNYLENFIDTLAALQNLPGAYIERGIMSQTKRCWNFPTFNWGRMVKEAVNASKLNKEMMGKLRQNRIVTELLNDACSDIKLGMERGEILLNEEFDAVKTFQCTKCNASFFCTYEETLEGPVELFRKMYEVHLKNLHEMADKGIKEQDLRTQQMQKQQQLEERQHEEIEKSRKRKYDDGDED
ncbi:cyclic GMP-AMP synthase-like receptor 2 [Clytia hemisphaerica]|uniref:Mab-21-like HhH/H2TH-like domain-containing protein n=1 Tax=Clytia hemisphaerica TaxID=252671 RepID=A0A7M5V077_9CNID